MKPKNERLLNRSGYAERFRYQLAWNGRSKADRWSGGEDQRKRSVAYTLDTHFDDYLSTSEGRSRRALYQGQ